MMKARMRGTTLPEVLIGGMITMFSVALMGTSSHFSKRTYEDSSAAETVKHTLTFAVERMSPDVRTAMKVKTDQSSSTQLVLVQPAVDATSATGAYQIPLTAGNTVAFYLGNTQGVAGQGTILWRAVNGTPDSSWSLENGRGRIDLKTTNLTFTYLPTSDPTAVQVSVTAKRTGYSTISETSSSEMFLRNHP